ncbi:MAG: acyl-ACP--UDP-N-acetylglucosamine O-acyltransferase [Parvularculaceae bacterium]
MDVHPTAIIESGAELGSGVSIGPYCRVGSEVRLGDDVSLDSHVVVTGETEIGARTKVFPFAILGGPPQHIAYKGEKTALIIGSDNIIREYVTMNPGTVQGRGVTKVGNSGLFMTGAHVAHDCIVGDNVIFANNATLGGHVIVQDYVFMGGLSAVHQYCRIGAYAFIGGCAAVPADVIPYGSAMGNHAYLTGLNIVGMKRRGVSRAAIHDLRAAYRLLFAEEGTFQERLEDAAKLFGEREEVMRIVNFIGEGASRPLMTPAH